MLRVLTGEDSDSIKILVTKIKAFGIEDGAALLVRHWSVGHGLPSHASLSRNASRNLKLTSVGASCGTYVHRYEEALCVSKSILSLAR